MLEVKLILDMEVLQNKNKGVCEMNTERFILTLGINEGYFHNNNCTQDILTIGKIANNISQQYFNEHNIYVTFSIIDSRTFYSNQWGCPNDGEETIIITGVANPSFVSLEEWKNAVIEFTKEMKKELRQSTCTLEFIGCELIYFNND